MVDQTEREVAAFFGDAVNNMSFDYDQFGKGFRNLHRTLQQNVMKAFMAFVKEMSLVECPDLRNEATVAMCKKIVEATKDNNYLPYV